MSIFYSKEQDGTLNVRVSGYLTKEPKVTEKVVLFSVCYGRKKYMDCKAWANETAGQVAACLEYHDAVSVDGVYETYEGRDGEERKQLAVDAVFPMTVPTMADSHTERPAVEAKAEPVSSKWEDLSDDDGGLPF